MKKTKRFYKKTRIMLIRLKRTLFFIILILPVFFFLIHTAGEKGNSWVVQDISEPVLRVHILAHDDSPQEQSFKNRIKKDFLSLTSHYRNAHSYADLTEKIKQELEILEAAVNEKSRQYDGYNENRDIKVAMGQEYFPLRHYGEKVYPPGEYMALIVTIGEGKGENWWCLLYPPLCFPFASVSEECREPEDCGEDSEEEREKEDDIIDVMANNLVLNEELLNDKKEEKERRWKLIIVEWIKNLIEKE